MKKTNTGFKFIASLLAAVLMTSVLPMCVISASADSFAPGDVDMNNSVDSSDALLTMRYSVGLANLSEEQLLIADVNGDGTVDSMDALSVLQSACGICEIKPVERKDSVTKSTFASYAEKVTALCNEERAKVGVAPLELDETLCKAADIRASELDVRCDHIRADGTKWSTVLAELDFRFLTAGENVAGGVKTPEEVVDAWMNSEGHRKNILNPDFTKIGVGYAFIDDSLYGNYWSQIFAGVAENVESEKDSKTVLLEIINNARKEKGLAPLTIDTTLDVIAEIRANDITSNFSNTRPNGDDWKVLVEEYNVDYTVLSQSFCAGQKNESEVFSYYTDGGKTPKFLDSSKAYTKVGIGHTYSESSEYGNYWVLIFTD